MTIGASPSLGDVRTELGKTGSVSMDDSRIRFFGSAPNTPGSLYTMGTFIGKASENYALFVGQDGGNFGYYAVAANHPFPFGNISNGFFRGNQISGIFTFGGDLFFRLFGSIAGTPFNGIQILQTSFDGTVVTQKASGGATKQVITPGGVTETQWQWISAGVDLSPYLSTNLFVNLIYTP